MHIIRRCFVWNLEERALTTKQFFYLKRRSRQDSPNNAIEAPIIYELIGDFHDKNILDLGCGDVSFGKEILNQGARHHTGVEGSKQMAVNAETNLFGKNGTIHNDTMESYTLPNEQI
ncbi:hypothetical protein [Bacillus sp. V59.32b]|uniref:hypothetical protein n=1 Tax=Bacillus sp. V59.32b TaxID=1758642 RepID=UPI002693540D